jgi:hypothetical protein
MTKARKKFDAALEAKIALEAVRETPLPSDRQTGCLFATQSMASVPAQTS